MRRSVSLEFCPICGAEMGRRHGVVVTIGGSRGGWGQRTSFVDFREEVCAKCGDAIWSALLSKWRRTIGALRNAREAVVVTVAHDGEVKTQMPRPRRGFWSRLFGLDQR